MDLSSITGFLGNPMAQIGIGAGMRLLGAGMQGDGTPQVGYVDPGQVQYIQWLRNQARSGQGDFGFAREARMGQDALARALAGRGMSMSSGVGAAGLADVLARASSNAAGRRQGALFQAAGMSPASFTYQQQNPMAGTLSELGNLGIMGGGYQLYEQSRKPSGGGNTGGDVYGPPAPPR